MRTLSILLAAVLAACANHADGARPGKPLVVATTGMVADLARVVGGDRVEVTALMGAGVDPHLFQASPNDLELLRAADLVLYSGRGLEGKMGDVLVKLARRKPVVAVTDAIPDELLIEPPELEGHHDPHVWFDVALWSKGTGIVAGALAEVLPPHADEFRERAARYERELLALHEDVRRAVATIPRSAA